MKVFIDKNGKPLPRSHSIYLNSHGECPTSYVKITPVDNLNTSSYNDEVQDNDHDIDFPNLKATLLGKKICEDFSDVTQDAGFIVENDAKDSSSIWEFGIASDLEKNHETENKKNEACDIVDNDHSKTSPCNHNENDDALYEAVTYPETFISSSAIEIEQVHSNTIEVAPSPKKIEETSGELTFSEIRETSDILIENEEQSKKGSRQISDTEDSCNSNVSNGTNYEMVDDKSAEIAGHNSQDEHVVDVSLDNESVSNKCIPSMMMHSKLSENSSQKHCKELNNGFTNSLLTGETSCLEKQHCCSNNDIIDVIIDSSNQNSVNSDKDESMMEDSDCSLREIGIVRATQEQETFISSIYNRLTSVNHESPSKELMTTYSSGKLGSISQSNETKYPKKSNSYHSLRAFNHTFGVSKNCQRLNEDGGLEVYNEYFCNFCLTRSYDKDSFLKHVKSHIFVCGSCKFQSFLRVDLLLHILNEHHHLSGNICELEEMHFNPFHNSSAENSLFSEIGECNKSNTFEGNKPVNNDSEMPCQSQPIQIKNFAQLPDVHYSNFPSVIDNQSAVSFDISNNTSAVMNGETPNAYICPECDFSHTDYDVIDMHKQSKHYSICLDISKYHFICAYCLSNFLSMKDVLDHMNSKHKNYFLKFLVSIYVFVSSKNLWICPICKNVVSRKKKSTLIDHVLESHTDLEFREISNHCSVSGQDNFIRYIWGEIFDNDCALSIKVEANTTTDHIIENEYTFSDNQNNNIFNNSSENSEFGYSSEILNKNFDNNSSLFVKRRKRGRPRKNFIDTKPISRPPGRPKKCESGSGQYFLKNKFQKYKLSHFGKKKDHKLRMQINHSFDWDKLHKQIKIIVKDADPLLANVDPKVYLIGSKKSEHVQCTICGSIFTGKSATSHAGEHVLAHLGIRAFQCPYCDEKRNRKMPIVQHIVSAHPTQKLMAYRLKNSRIKISMKDDEPDISDIKHTVNPIELTDNKSIDDDIQHEEDPPSQPNSRYQCIHCNFLAKTLPTVRQHIVFNHTNEELIAKDLKNAKHRQLYICPVCDFFTHVKDALLLHAQKKPSHFSMNDNDIQTDHSDIRDSMKSEFSETGDNLTKRLRRSNRSFELDDLSTGENSLYSCCYCPDVNSHGLKDVIDHLRERHHNETPIALDSTACPVILCTISRCDFKASSTDELMKHNFDCHFDSNSVSDESSISDNESKKRIFENNMKGSKRKGTKYFKNPKGRTLSDARYYCMYCAFNSFDLISVQEHLRSVHPDKNQECRDQFSNLAKKKSRLIFCKFKRCNFATYIMKEMDDHECFIKVSDQLQCFACIFFCITMEDINEHLQTHKLNPYCEVGLKTISRLSGSL